MGAKLYLHIVDHNACWQMVDSDKVTVCSNIVWHVSIIKQTAPPHTGARLHHIPWTHVDLSVRAVSNWHQRQWRVDGWLRHGNGLFKYIMTCLYNKIRWHLDVKYDMICVIWCIFDNRWCKLVMLHCRVLWWGHMWSRDVLIVNDFMWFQRFLNVIVRINVGFIWIVYQICWSGNSRLRSGSVYPCFGYFSRFFGAIIWSECHPSLPI